MQETRTKVSPPYAAYSSFSKFINDLRDSGVPPRIDRSIFGNASGSLIYSILASLKALKLIDEAGVPTQSLRALVKAGTERERSEALTRVLQVGFPTLWGGGVDISTATAGQFDEHIRTQYDVKGSTVDKIAAFFIAAAADADIPLSAYLRTRRTQAASSGAKRNGRRRRVDEPNELDASSTTLAEPVLAEELKPLEYQLIDLMSAPDIDDEVKKSIWSLVQYLTARKARQQ